MLFFKEEGLHQLDLAVDGLPVLVNVGPQRVQLLGRGVQQAGRRVELAGVIVLKDVFVSEDAHHTIVSYDLIQNLELDKVGCWLYTELPLDQKLTHENHKYQ